MCLRSPSAFESGLGPSPWGGRIKNRITRRFAFVHYSEYLHSSNTSSMLPGPNLRPVLLTQVRNAKTLAYSGGVMFSSTVTKASSGSYDPACLTPCRIKSRVTGCSLFFIRFPLIFIRNHRRFIRHVCERLFFCASDCVLNCRP